MDWPIISAAVKPNIRSAAVFHEVTIPFRSLPTIASSLDSTIAAKSRASRSRRLVSVTSRAISDAPAIVPSDVMIGETVDDTSRRRPSLH